MLYSIRLDSIRGSTMVLENQEDPVYVRNVAHGIASRAKGRRKVVIIAGGKDLPGGANALDDLVYKLQQDKLELEEGARLRDRRDRDEDKFQKGTVANYDPSTGFGTIEVGGVEHVASPGTFLPGTGPSRPQLGDRVLVSLDRKGKVLGFMLDSDESA